MHAADNRRRRKSLFKMVGVLIILAGLGWLVTLTLLGDDTPAFSGNNTVSINSTGNIASTQQHELTMQDEVLHANLSALHKLDDLYFSRFAATNDKNELIEIEARMSTAEESFRKNIDSIEKEILSYPNRVDEHSFAIMIASFRLSLQNRISTKNLRNAILNNKAILNPDPKSMPEIKNELVSKNARIAYLEIALKSVQDKAGNTPVAAVIVNDEASILREQNLQKDKKIASLTTINNALQKDYDRVAKQVSDEEKKIETSEFSFKSRNVSLEKKIDELNTELRLAHVDCNLVRADASKIISNSKQRRILLSEALAILNSLSRSENASTQKKIQDKISRLNQVATNYRD